MDRREFDKFADEYSVLHSQNIAVTGELPDYFVEYKVRDIYNQMRATGDWRDDLRILDFGSGVGSSIPFYKQYFPSYHIVCADVSQRSLNLAIGRFGELASYVLFEGKTLPLKFGAVDMAFAACVFHHVPVSDHIALLREIRRVLSNNSGRLFLYEHNPLNPLTVHAVSNCVFDDNAVLIPSWKMRRQFQEAGYSDIAVRYRVFFLDLLHFYVSSNFACGGYR